MAQQRLRFMPAAGLLALLLLLPGLAAAQEIGGTVTDTTGGVLPGVTVEVRSPDIIEQVRTAVSDGNGQYLVVALEAGTYSVTYSLPGFGTLVREGIELSFGFTANIDVQLTVGDIAETITVSGATPVVDIQNVDQRAVMDRELIETIPSGKSISALGLLVPGMTGAQAYGTSLQQDSGGLTAQIMQRMSIHGGNADDQVININGMDVAEPHTQGGDLGYFPPENFEEMAFNYSGNSAEFETGGVSINMIPREGANAFSGTVHTSFSFPALLANNLDDDLRSRGLESGTELEENWSINPSVGGPIVEDRIWFFATHSSRVADLVASGLFHAVDPSAFVYEPDLSRPGVDQATAREQSINFTIQATAKDKLKAYWSNSATSRPRYLQGRALGALFVTPEAAVNNQVRTNVYQVNWVRPHTNRLLFEAGVSHLPFGYDLPHAEDAFLGAPGVFEVAPLRASRNSSSWLSGTDVYISPKNVNYYRGSMSYVTGSHNLKVGVNFNQQRTSTSGESEFWTQLWTAGGSPFRARFYAGLGQIDTASSLGIYAQEQWTLDRLTINAGVRFDRVQTGYPDLVRPSNQWVNEPFLITGQGVADWKDFQPRLGLAYDLRGDGRTALKFSASRYGSRDSTDWSQGVNPAGSNRTSERTWLDGRVCLDPAVCIPGDGLVQGDPTNPAPNGELIGPNTNLAWGLPRITTFHDPNWAFGWGSRESNWELSGGIQQELVSGMSLDVAYFRRIWVARSVVDDRALSSGDFDIGTVNVPSDSRLPGGGGGTLSFYDQRPGTLAVPDALTVRADDFGGETETWNGFDVTVDARIEGVLLQGGLSTGRTSRDYCDLQGALPEALVTRAAAGTFGADTTVVEHCSRSENWLTQVKLIGSYTFPYDIQVSATLQNQNGPERAARLVFGESSLGRPFVLHSGGVELNMIEPGTLFGERFNQLDVRLTKILNFGGVRLRAMLDLFNVMNANAVMAEDSAYGPSWLAPVVIMPGRLAKFGFQLDF
ncbi:MAG: carboxypeptidase regulatory-like domain-containing protein [Acidobacteria bacterium]|nr:carboxypeptidase regulatory-like domain-containing protein [Acidobacteriota bacterium]